MNVYTNRMLCQPAVAGACVLGLMMLGSIPEVAEAGKVRFANTEEGHAYNPVFSLDGKYIAFENNNLGGDVELFVSELTGDIAKDGTKVSLPLGGRSSGRSLFGGGNHVVANPTWHPEAVVFEGSNQGGDFRLYHYMPGGQAAWEMIDTQKMPGNLTFPYMLADGSNLVFVASNTGNGDIYMRNSNTEAITQLTRSEHTESFPMLAADGSRVLFTKKKNDAEAVYEVVVSTGAEKEIVAGGGDQTRPIYGAGGKVVYFTSERGEGLWDIAVIGSGGKRTLARQIRLPLRARPALDPKGEWLAYTSDDPAHADNIMLTTLDGAKTVTIPTEFKACGEPALGWQGSRLMLAYTALPPSGSDWRFLFLLDITDRL